MLGDARFIRTLQLRNLLSFGPDTPPIELGPLNVLIGPNGSGKSNFIEAIDLLRASATDLAAPVRAGGGTEEWLWKGAEALPDAQIDVTLTYPDAIIPLRHRISFTAVRQRFALIEESIANDHARSRSGHLEFFSYSLEGVNLTSLLAQQSKVEGKLVTENIGRSDMWNSPLTNPCFHNSGIRISILRSLIWETNISS